jgi:hypothetical protein
VQHNQWRIGLASLALVLSISARPVSAQVIADQPRTIITVQSHGDCLFDASHPDHSAIATGYRDGVKGATDLIAMYVPCLSLQRALDDKSATVWLEEWLSYEVNRVGLEPEQWAQPSATIAQLCQDARTGHPSAGGFDFAAAVERAHTTLSPEKPVVYFGVIGEEIGACYLAALRLELRPAGAAQRQLTVTAFMLAARQWVYQSVRRNSDAGGRHDDVLALSRVTAQAFLRKNQID